MRSREESIVNQTAVQGKVYRFGIIGYGNMANFHFKRIVKPECIMFCAAYDINPKRLELAKQDGLNAYDDLEQMLDKEKLDVVLIATPNDSHKEYAIKAIERGIHVICEKPATMNADELSEIIKAAQRHQVLFTVHQNRRLDADYQIMKKVYEDNMLGKVFRIESRVQGSRELAHSWRRKKENGGGMLYDWGVHLIDQILYLIDSKVVSVYAEFQYLRQDEVDENVRVCLRFDNGLSVLVEIGTCNYIMLPLWYMCGVEGTAQIDYWDLKGKVCQLIDTDIAFADEIPPSVAGPSITLSPRAADTMRECPLPSPTYDKDLFYKNFVSALEGNEELFVKPEEVLRVAQIIDLAFESGRRNEVIQCNI